MRLPHLSMLVAIATLVSGPGLTDVVQVSRYTLVSTTPYADQVDPLDAVVSVSFPRQSVRTVGDAVNSLLSRSGYAVAQDGWALPLSFPLPDVQRRFDNVDVRQILQALGGTGYLLHVDPATRSVAYALRPDLPPPFPPTPQPSMPSATFAEPASDTTPDTAAGTKPPQTGEPISLLPSTQSAVTDEESRR